MRVNRVYFQNCYKEYKDGGTFPIIDFTYSKWFIWIGLLGFRIIIDVEEGGK